MGVVKDPQLTIQRFGLPHNPKLSDGPNEIEFTYPPDAKSGAVQREINHSLHTTIGGARRIQADSSTRVARISWFEPSNFIPTSIEEMLYGAGDRTVQLSYTHCRPIISQLGDGVEPDDGNGIVIISGFILPPFRYQRIGKDISGTQEYMCSMVFIESEEVQL